MTKIHNLYYPKLKRVYCFLDWGKKEVDGMAWHMILMKTSTCAAYTQRYILMSAFPMTHSTIPWIGRSWVPSSRWETWGPETHLSKRDPSNHGRFQTQSVRLPSWNQAHFSTSYSSTSKVSFIVIDPNHIPQSRSKRGLRQESSSRSKWSQRPEEQGSLS